MTSTDAARVPRVVVASDSFKGSLGSADVGVALSAGLHEALPHVDVVVVPVADGGEGTVDAAVWSGFSPVPALVHGPTGDPVTATVAIDGDVAVVEMADACGLGRLPDGRLRPLAASSRGLGEAILAALEHGARTVVVGVGGSASTDGGAGMLSALGARVLGADGTPLPEGGGPLVGVASLDLTGLDPRLREVDLVLAADVDTPLLGPRGAAAVFGPQKGASPHDVEHLETALTAWARVAGAAGAAGADGATRPGAGAAGGVGFALLAVLGASLRPGVDVVLDLVGLDDALAGADLAVTGEGSLDGQTASGKAVTGVVRRAASTGVPVVAVCGRTDLDEVGVASLGLRAAYPLSALEPDPARSMAGAADLLRTVGRRIGQERLSAPA